MKNTLQIMATIDQEDFLRQLVEGLAQNRQTDLSGTDAIEGWKDIDTSSLETYVSGSISLDFASSENGLEERINMPFITCFLFTCNRHAGVNFGLEWGSSMN